MIKKQIMKKNEKTGKDEGNIERKINCEERKRIKIA